jgi:hypothetical protein
MIFVIHSLFCVVTPEFFLLEWENCRFFYPLSSELDNFFVFPHSLVVNIRLTFGITGV